MPRPVGSRLLLAALAVALVGALAASCGGAETAAPPPETTAPETTAPETTPPETTAPETQPPPAQPKPEPTAITVRITVKNGRAVGGIVRETLKQGAQVVLVVTSDVADHVHLHGYDVMVDVRPGTPARLRFEATIPGRFEVELEDRRLQIADLQVRP